MKAKEAIDSSEDVQDAIYGGGSANLPGLINSIVKSVGCGLSTQTTHKALVCAHCCSKMPPLRLQWEVPCAS